MLNAAKVLKYIKTNLSYKTNFIEMEDDEILDYVKMFTLAEFSSFFPDKNSLTVDLTNTSIKVPNKSNEYYIFDPDGLEIINIVGMYPEMSEYLLAGNPIYGPLGFGDIRNWALQTEATGWVHKFSSFTLVGEFKHPNILVVAPHDFSNARVTVEYERIQPEDFSKIPNEQQMIFMELALADIMIIIGRSRQKYGDGNLQTPFGNIPLSGAIFDEGTNRKRELIEQLKATQIPNVTISFG